MPTNLTEDKYVAAVELRPGNPQVVHHLLALHRHARAAGRKLEKAGQENEKNNPVVDVHTGGPSKYDRGPGYTRTMGVGFLPRAGMMGWAPGIQPRYMPEGVGFHLPKNSDIVMQIHYHRNGRVEKDRTQVGLYFAKKKIEHPYQAGAVTGGSGTGPLRFFFSIPPGDGNFKLDGDAWATQGFHDAVDHAAHAPARQGDQRHDDAAGAARSKSCWRSSNGTTTGRRCISSRSRSR